MEAARTGLPEGFAFEVVAAPGLPAVDGDRDKVRQVLMNLLDNAVKYSPHDGRIELRIEPAERGVRLAVRDQGLGIPQQEQPRIFEKFYRLNPALTRGVGGTGLGLYICRGLVERMHGRLWVESKEGRGSTFFVELPAAEPR